MILVIRVTSRDFDIPFANNFHPHQRGDNLLEVSEILSSNVDYLPSLHISRGNEPSQFPFFIESNDFIGPFADTMSVLKLTATEVRYLLRVSGLWLRDVRAEEIVEEFK